MKNEATIQAERREELVSRASNLLERMSYPSSLLAYVREWMDGKRDDTELADRLENEERLLGI
jgi:hypothetical protein